jgi:hypothetical protein
VGQQEHQLHNHILLSEPSCIRWRIHSEASVVSLAQVLLGCSPLGSGVRCGGFVPARECMPVMDRTWHIVRLKMFRVVNLHTKTPLNASQHDELEEDNCRRPPWRQSIQQYLCKVYQEWQGAEDCPGTISPPRYSVLIENLFPMLDKCAHKCGWCWYASPPF